MPAPNPIPTTVGTTPASSEPASSVVGARLASPEFMLQNNGGNNERHSRQHRQQNNRCGFALNLFFVSLCLCVKSLSLMADG